MISRGTFGLCCVHFAQLVTHPAIYTLLLTFAVMSQASWHTAEGK